MSGLSIIYIEGSKVVISKTYCILSLKIDFVLANSADLDEIQYHAAFHLGLHCCQRTHLGVFCLQRVNDMISIKISF